MSSYYYLNTSILDITWASNIDACIRRLVKKALRLPRSTTTSFFYTSKQHGGLGLTSILDSIHNTRIMRVVKCLTSRDKTVSGVALSQLQQTVKYRRRLEDVQTEDIVDFLNHPPLPQEKGCRDVKSLWSAVRKSLAYLTCSIEMEGTNIFVVYDDRRIGVNRTWLLKKMLREAKETKHLECLLQAPDQGSAFQLVTKDPVSSHWIRDGKYLSFSNYRFALRARLNLLPTKAVVKRYRRTDFNDSCPRCHNAEESMAHVLNACPYNAGLMRERHNTIVKRLIRAVPDDLGETFVEQKIKDYPDDLRPDLVVINEEKRRAVIVDVTIPIESNELSFDNARNEKLTKYAPITEWFKNRNYEVSLHAFIVGSLGSWDPENAAALRDLRIGRNYSHLFKKLCVVDALKGSHCIWLSKSKNPPVQ